MVLNVCSCSGNDTVAGKWCRGKDGGLGRRLEGSGGLVTGMRVRGMGLCLFRLARVWMIRLSWNRGRIARSCVLGVAGIVSGRNFWLRLSIFVSFEVKFGLRNYSLSLEMCYPDTSEIKHRIICCPVSIFHTMAYIFEQHHLWDVSLSRNFIYRTHMK